MPGACLFYAKFMHDAYNVSYVRRVDESCTQVVREIHTLYIHNVRLCMPHAHWLNAKFTHDVYIMYSQCMPGA